MKKIIKAAIPEKSQILCDKCGRVCEWGAAATITFHPVFGSQWDMMTGQLDFCSECANGVYKKIKKEFPKFKLEFGSF